MQSISSRLDLGAPLFITFFCGYIITCMRVLEASLEHYDAGTAHVP